MNSQKDIPERTSIISDFAEIVAKQEGMESPLVVGGHAVNLWSEYYLKRGCHDLAAYMPFTSKDLDLVGTSALLDRLHNHFKGTLTRSEPRSPVIGRIDVPGDNGDLLRVEILHTVNGLSPKDLEKNIELKIEGIAARVPLAHIILKAKLANAARIDQNGRQDVKHTRMMILCTNAFILEFLENCRLGKLEERTVINLLDEIREVIASKEAQKASELWGFDFTEIWPMETLKSFGGGKISRWITHRLA